MAQAVIMIKRGDTKDQEMTFDDFFHFEKRKILLEDRKVVLATELFEN